MLKNTDNSVARTHLRREVDVGYVSQRLAPMIIIHKRCSINHFIPYSDYLRTILMIGRIKQNDAPIVL